MYAKDALFEAEFDAYSLKRTGASQVNPEYEAVAMEKALRCAEAATEPVLTTFVPPWWDDKGSSYAGWLSHQAVQAVAAIDRSKFRFNAPRHWTDEDQWCTPKRNVHVLIVANEAGLQYYVKQDKLNKGFACASHLSCKALQTGREGQHSNRLEVLDAEDWLAPADDCHRPVLEAIGHEFIQRAPAGDETILLKIKSHIGIHSNEIADKLANEAADGCCTLTMTYLMTTHDHSGTSFGCNRPFKCRQQNGQHKPQCA